LNIFEKHVKKPLLEQNFSLIKVNFGRFFMAKILPKSLGDFLWLKFCPNHWAIFSRKKFAQRHKKLPKWRNFAQSGHPASKLQLLVREIDLGIYGSVCFISLSSPKL
jgi:hypothetical protein